MQEQLTVLKTPKGTVVLLDKVKVLEIEKGKILYQNASDKIILDCLAKILNVYVGKSLQIIKLQTAIKNKIINKK